MQRALAAALICKGESILNNTGISIDSQVAKNIIQNLGAVVTDISSTSKQIMSEGFPHVFFPPGKKIQIFCGESGLSTRMFAPIASLCTNEIILTGEEQLTKRPMDFFDTYFPLLNIKIKSENGKLPIVLQGPLIPKNIDIDCSEGSQYLTGLLMAYSAVNANDVMINVKNLKSPGYIRLTLDIMKKFGMQLPVYTNFSSFYFDGKLNNHLPKKRIYTIESDWSNSAFLFIASAIAGQVCLNELDMSSEQPDKIILQILENCGALISYKKNSIEISKSNLRAFQYDATDTPDLFPPLAALAACCSGTSTIGGVHRLTHKESNRSEAILKELKKMNIPVQIIHDQMIIQGTGSIQSARIESHGDHRIAMMCSILALVADGETIIDQAEVVGKSYPHFFRDLQSLGAAISIH